MFEKTDEGNWKFTHNPFSMPKIECLEDFMAGKNIESIIAQQYDIVMNGSEI
jgi:aspartyl-tRNA synthetase